MKKEFKKLTSTEGEDIPTQDEAFAKTIAVFSETKQPDILTELNDNEIKLLTALLTLADYYNDQKPGSGRILELLAWNFMRLKVSKRRKGRLEIMKIAQASKEEQLQRSKWQKLMSLGRA